MADAPPTIRIRKWGQFQHYKERTPPWIKFHRSILDKKEWHALSGDGCKLLAECWLVASEHPDGLIELSTADLTWRLRRTDAARTAELLQELARLQFIDISQHDALAVCTHDASEMIDRGEAEGEREAEGETVDKSTDGEPSEVETEIADLDVSSDTEWRTLQVALFEPLRKHIWKGSRPPSNVPKNGRKWDEARELSCLRDWIRGGLLDPDEAETFLQRAPIAMGWKHPASLSWLQPDDQLPRIREIVGEIRKDSMTGIGEVLRAG